MEAIKKMQISEGTRVMLYRFNVAYYICTQEQYFDDNNRRDWRTVIAEIRQTPQAARETFAEHIKRQLADNDRFASDDRGTAIIDVTKEEKR